MGEANNIVNDIGHMQINQQIISVLLVSVLTVLLGCTPQKGISQSSQPVEFTKSETLPLLTDTQFPARPTPSLPAKETTPSEITETKTTELTTSTSTAFATVPVISTPPLSQTRPLPPLDAFQKGMCFADYRLFVPPTVPPDKPLLQRRLGQYEPVATRQSLEQLASTGTNWIALIMRGGQETIQSTDIFYKPPATASDDELRRTIDLAHSLGMRVMLHPQVHMVDPTQNHIFIGRAYTTEAQWQAWFTSYRQFIIHYATLSRDAGVDMLCIGNELESTIHREADWRRVVQEVRVVYKGPILYEATTHPDDNEAERITWWDAVDYIATDVWYSLTDKNDPTVAELKEAWTKKGLVADLENFSKQFNKPFIISEIGYQARDGTNKLPWDAFIGTPIDDQEQADCYQVAMEFLWGKPWLKGIFWYQWGATAWTWTESPQGRPAEEVIKKFYLSQ